MAKAKAKVKGTTAPTIENKIITVKDLAEEFGWDVKKIRVILRSKGHKAPIIEDRVGFGPRAKYEWKDGSPELAAIKESLTEALAAVTSV